jgi:hypothetical protein
MTDFAAAASTAKRKKALEARLNGLKVAKSARQRAAAVRRCKVRKRAGLGVLRIEAPLGPLADRLAEDGFIGEWDFTPARFQSYAASPYRCCLKARRAEYEWPNPLGVGRFKPEHPVTKLEGDYDVFGDGSVTIIATPGHTPGHQSLANVAPTYLRCGRSARATRHHGDRSEGVDGVAVLIERRPFDPHDSLQLRL